MKKLIPILILTLIHSSAFAWGRRGHQMVAETAALLVSAEPDAGFMRGHSFDLAYYANVPDFVWKGPSTYNTEKKEHYLDLDSIKREFAKQTDIKNPLALSRKDFEAKFPTVTPDMGRSYWRIRELNEQLSQATQALKDLKEPKGAARQKLQEKWIVLAGVMAHYVGDMGMPLHASENHDGQLTNQKGIHSYFEDEMVNQLYPAISTEIYNQAQKKWPAFKKQNSDKSVLQLIDALGERSIANVPKLLNLDKRSKRDNIKANTKLYRAMIVDRIVDSTLVLAELYRRQVDFPFDDNRFYFFAGLPAYVYPGDNPTDAKAEATPEKK